MPQTANAGRYGPLGPCAGHSSAGVRNAAERPAFAATVLL